MPKCCLLALLVSFLLPISEAYDCGDPQAFQWCPDIMQSNIKSFEIMLNASSVSSNLTSCYEQIFELPMDQDYEIISWETNVTNPDVVFYIIVYQCDTQEYGSVTKPIKTDPVSCSLMPPCTTTALVYNPSAFVNRCYDRDFGMRFGKNYFNTTVLRVYYYNPNLIKGLSDSSGFRIYYQPLSRRNNLGLVAFGQQDITIPPQSTQYHIIGSSFGGKCSNFLLNGSSCYTFLSIQVVMHLYGDFAAMTVIHADGSRDLVFHQCNMAYNQPGAAQPYTPGTFNIYPGDSVLADCRYNTMATNGWTYFGEYGLDEMCYMFVEISPPVQHNILHFSNFFNDVGALTMCDALPPFNIKGCNGSNFVVIIATTMKQNLNMVTSCLCSQAARPTACSSECWNYLNQTGLMRDPCMETDEALQSLVTYWIGSTSDVYRVKVQTDICRGLKTAPAPNTGCVAPSSA